MVLSVRRLSNIVQMLVDMNSAAVKDDSQVDLRMAAKLMGQLLHVRFPLRRNESCSHRRPACQTD